MKATGFWLTLNLHCMHSVRGLILYWIRWTKTLYYCSSRLFGLFERIFSIGTERMNTLPFEIHLLVSYGDYLGR